MRPLIPDFIDAGFDITNPVQCSAADMDPADLEKEFGAMVTFWGGGVDTQKTLPFGTPEDVRREVGERVRVFGPGGGFMFNPVHNVQARTPVENLLAMYKTLRKRGEYLCRASSGEAGRQGTGGGGASARASRRDEGRVW